MNEKVFSLENIVPCSDSVHRFIHYGGDINMLIHRKPIERTPNDTCPWRNNVNYAKYFNS